jgi:hypothetical protein
MTLCGFGPHIRVALLATFKGNDTAVMKIGDFKVDFLCKFEAIFKKALTRVSGA